MSLRWVIIVGFISSLVFSAGAIVAVALGFGLLAALLIAGAVLATALHLVLIAGRVLGPLRTLKQEAGALALGGGHHPLLAGRRADEVGELAGAWDQALASLDEARAVEEQRRLRAEESARAVINSLPHAVAVISPDGQIEMANSAAESFGLLAGKNVVEARFKWIPAMIQQVRDTLRPVWPQSADSAIQIFDGGKEQFYVPHATPLLERGDRLAGITLIVLDVTQIRVIEEAKFGLLSTISHELKTPMTSIQMSIHLLLEDMSDKLSGRQMELLRAAADDADRLEKLIEKVLNSARHRANFP